MVYLFGILLAIALSVWLWGSEPVKRAIKFLLGASIAVMAVGIAWVYITAQQEEKERKQAEYEVAKCHKKQDAIYMTRPVCARAITTVEEEEANKCRIDWNLQNDEGIKAKPSWEMNRMILGDGC